MIEIKSENRLKAESIVKENNDEVKRYIIELLAEEMPKETSMAVAMKMDRMVERDKELKEILR